MIIIDPYGVDYILVLRISICDHLKASYDEADDLPGCKFSAIEDNKHLYLLN